MLIRSLLLLLGLFGLSYAQSPNGKKILQHSDYDHWKSIASAQLHELGDWVSYEVNPGQGDGKLMLQATTNEDMQSFPRGNKAAFAPDGSFLAFLISPHHDSLRQAKLAKVKDAKLPKDSLGVWLFSARELRKIPRVKSMQVPKKAGSWMAYQLEKPLPPAKPDSTETEGEEAESEESESEEAEAASTNQAKAGPLFLLNPASGTELEQEPVESFVVDEYGEWIGWLIAFGDSIDSTRIQLFRSSDQQMFTLYEGPGYGKSLKLDGRRDQAAFLFSADTAEVKTYQLWHWKDGQETAEEVVSDQTEAMPQGCSVHADSKLAFSEDGTALYFGTGPAPKPEPKDTLTDEEKYSVDVWNWQDDRLQPQQQKELKEDKSFSYQAVWFPETDRMVQLATETVPDITRLLKGNSEMLMGSNSRPYQRLMSWEWPSYRNLFAVDRNTGEARLLLEKAQYSNRLSPGGNYALWYDPMERAWFSKQISTGQQHNLTGKLKVNFFDELHDSPMEPNPYRVIGWTEGDASLLLLDRYDVWKIDPSGEEKPICLSNKFGRKNKIRLTYQRLDRESVWLEPESILLHGLQEESKRESFYYLKLDKKNTPALLIESDHHYSSVQKAEQADRLIWRKQSFTEYPDLWTSDLNFENAKKLSEANPQQEEYLWGEVELVSWKTKDGEKLLGKFYRPENFDPAQKYPMLIYFYERSSDGLHTYISPSPSRSTIRPSFCVSNGYLVFVPDITYPNDQPGPDALRAIMSGTDHLLETYDFIDSTRMGLQGQSWGGYQVAYIVTQTDRFAAAMAGAPVSNMTSAYGGIRWGSGLSRMFQYEESQSRLGTTLWEDPQRYLDNSPLFFAPEVKTPLLMMHNDTDGAVPWYQSIEFFVSLRRLQKPSWLLVYNQEQHNLTKWPNRVDLSIRMHQFFDHYLKDAPLPVWMGKGLPAIDKGKRTGYELMEESADSKGK